MESDQLNLDKITRQKTFIIRVLYWGIIIFCCLLFAKYIMPVLIPFFIALVIAAVLNRPINYISRKSHIKRKVVSLFAVILFYVFAAGILIWIFTIGIDSIIYGFSFLPDVFEKFFSPLIYQMFQKTEIVFDKIDPAVISMIETNASDVIQTFRGWVIQFSENMLSWITGIFSQIPSLFMKTVITVIVTFFIAMDFPYIEESVKKCVPPKRLKLMEEIKIFIFHTIPRFILNYGLILLMTFFELWIGLRILKIPYAGIIAALIAVLDILPVLGTGGVLIPWGIIELILGDFSTAAGIMVIYVIITVVRNIVEPKLIGKQMGLHPVITLASMLVGLNLLGIAGLFGFPLILSFVKNIMFENKINS